MGGTGTGDIHLRPADRRRDSLAASRIPVSLTDEIKAHAVHLGFDLAGVTSAEPPANGEYYAKWLERGMAGEMAYLGRQVEKRQDPGRVLPDARSIVVVAMNYRCPESEPIPGGTPRGRIAMYARGDDYHDVMKEKLQALLRFVKDRAGRPVEGKVYVDTGPVLEREFAVRAGMGWFGKHTNLIHKRVGSWLLIGEILLDLELDEDRPAADHCGTCTMCLEACPTDAIVEPYVVDSRRCISYPTIELKDAIPIEYRAAMGDRVFGCDDCQDVCPWNRRAPTTRHAAFYPRAWNEMPGLIEMLGWSPEEFRTRFKGSPIKRTKRRGLLRNAAVALGNTKDPQAVPALIASLDDDEPLVRSHAAWALGNIGGDRAHSALEDARMAEGDPAVIAEIDGALSECGAS